MKATAIIAGVEYHAEIEPKKPFRVTLSTAGQPDHYGHWDRAIEFDPNKYSDLGVKVGSNSDGSKHAILPWKEGIYEALEIALKMKLMARRCTTTPASPSSANL